MSEDESDSVIETESRVEEIIEAEDGPMEARVTVEAFGPETEATAKLAEALAGANRSIVTMVFSGPEDAPDAESGGLEADGVVIRTGDDVEDDEDGEGGDGGRIMDYGGPS